MNQNQMASEVAGSVGNDAILSRYRQGAEKKRLSKPEKEVLANMPNLGNANNDDSKKNM